MDQASLGGVVLCGGQSQRMGYPKALLPFGDEFLLQRVVRTLGQELAPLAVVHAIGQNLPSLLNQPILVSDDEPNQGPLRGLACGLSALDQKVEFAFVTSCDAPFVSCEWVNRLNELRGDKSIAILSDSGRHYPLCAIYATSLGQVATDLLNQGARRPIALLDYVEHAIVPVDSLRSIDPELAALTNVNDPTSYEEALQRAGLKIDPDFRKRIEAQSDDENRT